RLFGIRSVLNDPEAEDDIVLRWSEGQLQHIRLQNPMALVLRKILLVGFYRDAQINGGDAGARREQDLSEPAGTASHLQDVRSLFPIQHRPGVRSQAAACTVSRYRRAREGGQLRLPIDFPLQ